MKKLISISAAFALILTCSISAAKATGIPGDSQSAHIVGGRSYPDYPTWRAFHDFEVHVQGKALLALTIDLPDHVKMCSGIDVTNQNESK
ncbi:hypothetical protein QUA54_05840 [Microcoleus sp. MOSTC5]|uniref:hypothetical protein n=1 Tax=Microcoleus sp. MOSTC5 TaxID=3055378 RepID=UPI002FD158A5